jgi:hypothetical protein
MPQNARVYIPGGIDPDFHNYVATQLHVRAFPTVHIYVNGIVANVLVGPPLAEILHALAAVYPEVYHVEDRDTADAALGLGTPTLGGSSAGGYVTNEATGPATTTTSTVMAMHMM